MKILTIHADHLKFKPVKVAIKEAEIVSNKEVKLKDCLVVFTAVEQEDEKNPKIILDKLVNEIKLIAAQIKEKNIVLYPYAHLSSKLSSPKFALQMLKDAESKLKKSFKVTRAPFGHYKKFEISTKGHPLSELSREILADSKGIEKIDKPLEIQIKELSKLDKLRNTFTLLVGKAVLELFPNSKPALNFLDEDKFYYDFEKPHPFTPDDIKRVERKIHELLNVKIKKSKSDFKNSPYKKEILKDIKKAKIYELVGDKNLGSYKDLILGEILEEIPKNSVFKLLTTSGVYWKGSQYNKQLQRIYGIAFENQKDLDNYLKQVAEAEKRDHRTLGKQLELFTFSDLIGKGLPIWLPKGTIVKNEVEKFVEETEEKYGFLRVSTPHIAKKELFLQSGHLPYYKDSMYPEMNLDDGTYYLKPMNCPFHHIIYNSKLRSYKELPLRLAEYGTVYRNELSGTLAGLIRVRMLSMNDAHIYCTKSQIEEEFKSVVSMVKEYFETFGLKDFWFRLSLHDPLNKSKYIDQPENWRFAENTLRNVLKKLNVKFIEKPDEAAFYGPKLDIQFKSVTGREETMSTIQLDFIAKEKFNLKYIDKDGKENNEVFVIHRAPLSTHERFTAFLLEHFSGKLPLWLSPVQVSIITVTDRAVNFAKELENKLKENNIRVELNDKQETLGKKVLESSMQKIPYIITIGDKELENKTLAVRTRDGEVKFNVKTEEFLKLLKEEILSRSLNSKL
ncbi:MAG: threonine--tRNA ligase [Nanoarchaeota archaeon]